MAFRTIRLHTCFRQDLGEPFRPEKCRCRKLIASATALAFIDEGTAVWRVDWEHMIACPATDCRPGGIACVKCRNTGRNPKNPRVPCSSCAKELFKQNPCARCGGSGVVPTQTWDLVRTVRAHKTPRVMTIERANIERATESLMRAGGKWVYKGGDVPEDAVRIETWGQLTDEIRRGMIVTYWPEPEDPFRGRVMFPFAVDNRTSVGRTVGGCEDLRAHVDAQESSGEASGRTVL